MNLNYWIYIENINSYLVNFTKVNSNDIALAFVATCLVLFGNNINGFVRRRVINLLFIFRILIFILLCAFGYGLITVTIQPVVHSFILEIPKDLSFIIVALSFITLGILAEKKRIM